MKTPGHCSELTVQNGTIGYHRTAVKTCPPRSGNGIRPYTCWIQCVKLDARFSLSFSLTSFCQLMLVKRFITILVLLSMSACRGDDFHRHRILDWGRHYYDRTRDYNNTGSVLDLDGLAELFGSDFTTPTPAPFHPNDSGSLQCAIVPFGYLTYAVSRPMFVGSFNNATFGLEFYIRVVGEYSDESDLAITLLYDEHRNLRSISYRSERFESSSAYQVWISEYPPDAAVWLGRRLRRRMRRQLPHDDHSHWGMMANFVEKFVLAVDNHIDRDR